VQFDRPILYKSIGNYNYLNFAIEYLITRFREMDEQVTPSIEWIKHNLEYLASLDKKYWVFGAQTHQYNSYPLSNDEIVSFEGELGVRLPEDYRQVLLEIGYGAGPYYGLYSPKEILRELREPHFSGGGTGMPDPSNPFPFSREQADDCYQTMGEGRQALFGADWPTDGCIPICTEGCSFYTFLVTSGELAGSLWSHCSDWDNEDDPYLEVWNLAPKPPGIRLDRIPKWEAALSPSPSFLEWYGAWLERSITDFLELPFEYRKMASAPIKPVASLPTLMATQLPVREIKNKSFAKKIVDELLRKK
jgi:hypothetical protein